MVKLAFFKVYQKGNFSALLKTLHSNTSETVVGDAGFQAISFNETSFKGKFFVKSSYTNEVVGLDGEVQEIYYEYFTFVNFYFLEQKSDRYLVLITPPRSIRNIVEYFSNLYNFEVNINSITIDLEKLAECYKEKPQFQVLKVKFSNIHISKESIALVDIISSNNALNDFKKVFTSPSVKFKKIKFSFSDFPEKALIEASDNANIVISDNYYKESIVFELAKIISTI